MYIYVCMYIYNTFLLTEKLWNHRYFVIASLPWNQLPPCNKTINKSTSTFKHKLNNDLIVPFIRTSTKFVFTTFSVVFITLITFFCIYRNIYIYNIIVTLVYINILFCIIMFYSMLSYFYIYSDDDDFILTINILILVINNIYIYLLLKNQSLIITIIIYLIYIK